MGQIGEQHYSNRIGWLRASVLGANDGIVSTASLVIGVAAQVGGADRMTGAVRVTVWGALAMAATAGIGSIFDVTV